MTKRLYEHARGKMGEEARAYLERLRVRNYSPRTVYGCDHALRRFAAYAAERGIERNRDVTLETLRAFSRRLHDRGSSVGYRECVLSHLRGFYAWLTERGDLFEDPAQRLEIPRRKHRVRRVPSEEEMERLLAQPRPDTWPGLRDRALLEVAYGCGLRRGELAGLDLADLNLAGRALHVLGKGRKDRFVPLGRRAVKGLRAYLRHARPRLARDERNRALWLNRNGGGRLQGYTMQKELAGYCEAAAIRPALTFHALRRACATHMLRNGAHPVAIQKLLGHEDLKTLKSYLEVTQDDVKKTHRKTKPGR
jgi:site-specific recombinase XerD